LGNRRYFSNEECDACNDAYAVNQDNHLVKQYSLQRVMHAVRGRDGYITLKPDEQEGATLGATAPNMITVRRSKGDSSVAFSTEENNTGKLSVDLPSYKPAHAIQGLLRSCWLLMSVESRQRYPYLLNWIRTSLPVPTRYLSYVLREGIFEYAELGLWERNAPVAGASLVLRFMFCDTVMVWALPDASGVQEPALLPPFEVGHAYPRASICSVESSHAELTSIRASYDFTFDSRIRQDCASNSDSLTIVPASPPPPTTRSVPVLLCVKKEGEHGQRLGDISHTLMTILEEEHQDALIRRLRLSRGALAGVVTVNIDSRLESATFHFTFLPHLLPAKKALVTLEWLMQLQGGAELSVLVEETGSVLFRGQAEASVDLASLVPLLSALARVNEAFGTDIRFPDPRSTFDWTELAEVDRILKGEAIEQGPGTLSVVIDSREAIGRVMGDAGAAMTFVVEYDRVEFTISGQVLCLGPCRTKVINPKIVPDTGGRAETNAMCLAFEKLVHRYSSWPASKPVYTRSVSD
jgi:hypothetical protein